MANSRFYTFIALGLLIICCEHPKFLSSADMPYASQRNLWYSLWPGQLEGCVFKPSPFSSRISFAAASTTRGYTVFDFNVSSGQCTHCLPQNVSRYSSAAGGSFYLQRRHAWWVSNSRGFYIESGISAGQIFEIFGTVSEGATRFTVFWRPGPIHELNEDLAVKKLFSFNNPDGDQQLLFKSKIEGVGTIKKIVFNDPLLVSGQEFRMLVLVTSVEYVVYIDDVYCGSFEHVYTDLSSIRYLFVNDNPVIKYIVF